jgi:hypothetical protein
LISAIAQGVVNGPRNIDVVGVAADALLPLGSNAAVSGLINVRPFAINPDDKFSLAGYNKSYSQAFLDAGVAGGFGAFGNGVKAGLPALSGGFEKGLFEVDIGGANSLGQQIAGKVLTDKLTTQK